MIAALGTLMPWASRWLVLVLFAAGLIGFGYVRGLQAEQVKWTNSRNADAAAQLKVFMDAANRRAAIATKLASDRARLDQQARDRKDALRKVTTGVMCFSGAAVRVLNSPTGTVSDVPKASGQPSRADPGEPSASDRDVGDWISEARKSYADCVKRRQALIDFVK